MHIASITAEPKTVEKGASDMDIQTIGTGLCRLLQVLTAGALVILLAFSVGWALGATTHVIG